MKPFLKSAIVTAILVFATARFSLVSAQNNPPAIDKASIVVATVDGQTITAAQLDAITADQLREVTDPEIQLLIKTQALSGLINQTLVKQAIAQTDLKKNPEWDTQLKAIQEQGANNLYVNMRVGKVPEATPQLVEQIYRDNPDFYAKRYIYHYLMLSIPLNESLVATEIENTLKIGNSGFDAVKSLLNNRGIKYGSTNNWSGAEGINPNILTILKSLDDGQTRSQLSGNQKGLTIIKSVGRYSDPIDIEDARPTIIQKIAASRRNQMAAKVFEDLRAKATIQINDSALATETDKQRAITKADTSATLLEKLKVSWYFALLILAPAGLFSFYRSPPVAEKSTLPLKQRILKILMPRVTYSGVNFKKSFIQIAKEEFFLVWQSRFIQFTLMVLAVIWFWIPLFNLFNLTPPWVTLQKLMVLAFAGIAFGLFITALTWKVPLVRKIFSNRWVAVAVLGLLSRLVLFL